MAILNSILFWWYLSNTGTVLANGYFRYKPNYIKPFPLPALIPQKTTEKIENLVDQIIKQKQDAKPKKTVKIEKEIDKIIYELYKLNQNEIEILTRSHKDLNSC